MGTALSRPFFLPDHQAPLNSTTRVFPLTHDPPIRVCCTGDTRWERRRRRRGTTFPFPSYLPPYTRTPCRELDETSLRRLTVSCRVRRETPPSSVRPTFGGPVLAVRSDKGQRVDHRHLLVGDSHQESPGVSGLRSEMVPPVL